MGITRLVASWVAVSGEYRLNRRMSWIDAVAQFKVPFRFGREKGAQL